MKRTLCFLSVAFIASACGSGSSDDGQKPGFSSPKKNANYSSVVELKDAYVDAGGPCTDWQQTDVVSAALESGECDSATVLSIYVDRAEAKDAAEAVTSLFAGMDDPVSVLVGPNWIVNNDEDSSGLIAFKRKLGGTIVTGY